MNERFDFILSIVTIVAAITAAILLLYLNHSIQTLNRSMETLNLHIEVLTAQINSDPDRDESIVYKTISGKEYHRKECSRLTVTKIPISLTDAKQTLTPCKVCKP